jgi:hypothetical protein
MNIRYTCFRDAGVAELADAHDSKSCTFGYVGSIPTFGTEDYNIGPLRGICRGLFLISLLS